MWTGDFNWERRRQSKFSRDVSEWIDRMEMIDLWDIFPIDYTFTQHDYTASSAIDHILVSPSLLRLVRDAGVTHAGDVLSGHDPIWVVLDIPVEVPDKLKANNSFAKPDWDKAKQDEINTFTKEIDRRLSDIAILKSIYCNNVQCNCVSHNEDTDKLILDVTSCLIEVSYLTIPTQKKQSTMKKKPIPGRKDEVKSVRDESLYWHRVWREEGMPRDGWLFDTMRVKRNLYHRAVRRCRRISNEIRARNMFSAVMQGDLELLSEMRKTCSTGPPNLPPIVGGATGEKAVAGKFAEVY